jgi:signal transduction histidine kinase
MIGLGLLVLLAALGGYLLLSASARGPLLPAAIVLAAIAIAAGTLVSVTRPLAAAAAAARRLGQGDLNQRIEWRSHDSLGVIATELNRLAVRLRELRETEAGRRQMEFQLSDAVLQSIFEPVIVTDAKGQILKLNQAAAELLGTNADQRNALSRTPGGEKILTAIRDAVSMQRAVVNEGDAALLPMHIGNRQQSYRLRTSPIRDADNKLLGAVTTLEDVTEMANLDRFKTRFIAVASRKLRDPLERLRLAIYSLARGFSGELRPLQQELIAAAEQEAEDLSNLMTDLLEVAEVESGNRHLRLERLRPVDILEDARYRFADEARRRNIDLVVRAYPDLSYVAADRRALRSIFSNLLSNALRFSPDNSEIQLEADEIRDRIQFTVRDRGRGIETERLPSIFGRFVGDAQPGDSSTEAGTGLGLALVRRLVEAMGGQILVESRLGHGTAFRFTLPLASTSSTRHPVETG